MAKVASAARCEGLVCSPQELNVVAQTAPSLVKVTPGIRPAGIDAHQAGNDQTRVATPAEAIERGADILVVGRPITAAEDPVAAAESIAAGIHLT